MINHRENCTHAQTPSARKACRKAAKAAPKLIPACTVGRGEATHRAVLADNGSLIGAQCGAGLGRGVRRNSPVYRTKEDLLSVDITCRSCR